MKKRWLTGFLVVVLIAALTVSGAMAEAPKKPVEGESCPELTDVQKQEVKAIYDQMFELQKQLIGKYKSYGTINAEKAEKMLDYMDKIKVKIESEGYTPHFSMPNHKGKKWHKHKD